MKVALVSMPWMTPYRPSIQLGALQAWLNAARPAVEVDTFHMHLGVSRWMDYRWVKTVADGTLNSWLGETLSAYLLFPQRRPVLDQFLDFQVGGGSPMVDVGEDLLRPYAAFVREWPASVDWSSYALVGISVSLCQTLSSVLLARRLRSLGYGGRIVLGGPATSGRVGRSFLETFPELDGVVHGEGEQPLTELVDRLCSPEAESDSLDAVPGLMRRQDPDAEAPASAELPDLSAVGRPLYDDYFSTLRELPDRAAVLEDLELPVEGSRGCWWDRRACRPDASCQFCNLNLQWRTYREKPVEQQLGEVAALLQRHPEHQSRRLLFVDNGFRRHKGDVRQLFEGLRDRFPEPLQIYMEARANLDPTLWRLLAAAGVTHCQVGIEALSPSVLRKINKGTTALMNVEAMREMERFGIADPANLIFDLPYLLPAELDETVEIIRSLRAYGPLGPTRFFLNYGSPYYDRLCGRREEALPLEDRNYKAWRVLLPDEIERTLFLSERDYEVEVPGLAEATERLRQACTDWAEHYEATKAAGVDCLLAEVPHPEGGGDAMEIIDARTAERRRWRLEGDRLIVYRALARRRRVLAARARCSELSTERFDVALASLQRDLLVLRVEDEALALGIRPRDVPG